MCDAEPAMGRAMPPASGFMKAVDGLLMAELGGARRPASRTGTRGHVRGSQRTERPCRKVAIGRSVRTVAELDVCAVTGLQSGKDHGRATQGGQLAPFPYVHPLSCR